MREPLKQIIRKIFKYGFFCTLLRDLLVTSALALLPILELYSALKCPINRPITSGQGIWDTLRFSNSVLEEIMQAHGCRMEFFVGSTSMILPRYQQGKHDVMMEMWKDHLRETWDSAVDSGMWIPVGPVTSPAVQGVFIPRYVQ